tara:strand:+ start:228 stop:509 length:282 start_codon:yes stop_codon:yes gene_type:complete
MTYKEFLESLEELQLDLDSASEALELEISDIEAWEDEDEIPASAEKWIKKEKVEFVALNNTNEDENFEDEEKDLIESESLDFEEDENLDEEEK